MKAIELKVGDKFKVKGQRKFREVKYVWKITAESGAPHDHVGKLLIVDESCKQCRLEPEGDVILKDSSDDDSMEKRNHLKALYDGIEYGNNEQGAIAFLI